VQFFGGQQRESVTQVKPHLVTKNGIRPNPGTVVFLNAIFVDIPQQVQILFHDA
jgi:hypothetical protein